MCASMAITSVCGGNTKVDSDGGYPTYARAHEYVRRVTGPQSLPQWNDDFSRTRDEVFAMLHQAATLAEREND